VPVQTHTYHRVSPGQRTIAPGPEVRGKNRKDCAILRCFAIRGGSVCYYIGDYIGDFKLQAGVLTFTWPASPNREMKERFDFYGRHLLLSFTGCTVDLDDLELILKDMTTAIEAAGATILSHIAHRFDPHGISLVFLLSESHASIHTYPESGSCFLDIFTCGRQLQVENFGKTLEELWLPKRVSNSIKERFE
jgi:S-adenosylmethionine decarboxylase